MLSEGSFGNSLFLSSCFGRFFRVLRRCVHLLLDLLLKLNVLVVILQDAGFAHPLVPVFAPPSVVNVIFHRSIFHLSLEKFRLIDELPMIA